MKSLTGRIPSARGWALLLTMFLGAGLMIAACGDEEAPTPTTPAPAPAPTPPPAPEPEPTPDPPAVPTGLVVAERGADFIEWKWTPVEGAAGYEVQFSANEAFTDEDEIVNRTAEQITYRRTGLAAEANAYLRVRAYVGEGDARVPSAWSTHVTGMTTAPEPELPATPANLRILNTGSDYIIWTWDRVAGASGYEVQFSLQAVITDSDPTSVITGIASTTHRVANIASSTNGYLRVRAWSGSISAPVNGAWSGSVRGTTKAPPPPVPLSRPERVRSTGRDEDSITLGWSEVEDADHYLVRQRVATATAWSNASCGGDDHVVEDTSCVASGLAEGVAYDFSVRAVPDSSDSTRVASEWSAEIEATTVGETRPTTPGGTGDLNLRWSSEGTEITFLWDRIAGAQYESYTMLKYSPSSSPCPSLNHEDWDDATNEGVSTSKVILTKTAGSVTGVVGDRGTDDRSEVVGLCVRTKTDKTKLSFAWGVSAPVLPMVPAGAGAYSEKTNQATTALHWRGLTVVEDFSFTIRLLERRHNDFVGTAAAEAACDDGRFLRQRTAHIYLPNQRESVTSGLRPYMDYILCMKYANDAGETEWAVPTTKTTRVDSRNVVHVTPISTVPAKPPSPRINTAKATSTPTQWTTVWELPTEGRNDVPRRAAGYEIRTITYDVYKQGVVPDDTTAIMTATTTAPSEATCALDMAPADSGWTMTTAADVTMSNATDTLDGIDFHLVTARHASHSTRTNRNVNAQNVHLCVRGQLADGRRGPWVMSGAGTVLRQGLQ